MNTHQPLLPVTVLLDDATVGTLTQGRPCYRWLCAWLSALFVTGLAFVVYNLAADRATERSVTAGVSLTLSIATFVYFARQFYSSSHLTFMYCLRGATLAILVTIILETFSQVELAKHTTEIALPFMMLAVGVSEEGGKLLALLLFTSLGYGSVRNADGCCSTIVLKPQTLAILGVCVGFGFMITENIEYFYMVDMSQDPEAPEWQERLGRILTGIIRTFFNLHPLLTGWTAVRLGKRVWKAQGIISTHAGDWVHALWAPALVHGGFDLAVTICALFGFLGELGSLVLVGGVWWFVLDRLRRGYGELC